MGAGHSAGSQRPFEQGLPGKVPSPSCCPQESTPLATHQHRKGRKGAPMGATPLGAGPSALPSLVSCSARSSRAEQWLSFPPLFPVDTHVNNHYFAA